jgi:hypothetical protein
MSYRQKFTENELMAGQPKEIVDQPPVHVAGHIATLVQKEEAKGKLRVITLEEPAIIAKVQHTMRKGEKLSEWYARTGCGRAQVLTMTKAELTNFVTVADSSAQDEWKPGNTWVPTPAQAPASTRPINAIITE